VNKLQQELEQWKNSSKEANQRALTLQEKLHKMAEAVKGILSPKDDIFLRIIAISLPSPFHNIIYHKTMIEDEINCLVEDLILLYNLYDGIEERSLQKQSEDELERRAEAAEARAEALEEKLIKLVEIVKKDRASRALDSPLSNQVTSL
jgi:hypothetical protein